MKTKTTIKDSLYTIIMLFFSWQQWPWLPWRVFTIIAPLYVYYIAWDKSSLIHTRSIHKCATRLFHLRHTTLFGYSNRAMIPSALLTQCASINAEDVVHCVWRKRILAAHTRLHIIYAFTRIEPHRWIYAVQLKMHTLHKTIDQWAQYQHGMVETRHSRICSRLLSASSVFLCWAQIDTFIGIRLLSILRMQGE